MLTQQDKLIIFDWDGTLMDSVLKIVACLEVATLEVGLEPRHPQQLRQIIGLGLREAITTLFPKITEDQIKLFTQAYRQHYLNDCKITTTLFKGSEKILNILAARGYSLAVATSKGRHGLDIALKQSNLNGFFNTSRCADETCSKPNPQMLFEIMAELKISAEHTLMVGDSAYDMDMAQRAGVRSIAVTYGVHEAEQLKKFQPIACINDISDFEQLLPVLTN